MNRSFKKKMYEIYVKKCSEMCEWGLGVYEGNLYFSLYAFLNHSLFSGVLTIL
jgi:hypothetical protein